MADQVIVRPALRSDDVVVWMRRSWGATVMAVRDELYDLTALPALVAVRVGAADLLGASTYLVDAVA